MTDQLAVSRSLAGHDNDKLTQTSLAAEPAGIHAADRRLLRLEMMDKTNLSWCTVSPVGWSSGSWVLSASRHDELMMMMMRSVRDVEAHRGMLESLNTAIRYLLLVMTTMRSVHAVVPMTEAHCGMLESLNTVIRLLLLNTVIHYLFLLSVPTINTVNS